MKTKRFLISKSFGSPLFLVVLGMGLLLPLLTSCNASDGAGADSPTATESDLRNSSFSDSAAGQPDRNGSDAENIDSELEGTLSSVKGPLPNINQTLISAEGIGPAQLGMTLGTLKQALGKQVEFSAQSPFIADFDAIAVRQGDQTLFYLLHLVGDPLQDSDVIQGVLTTNPRYETSAGVGVGTSIQTAEAAYGNATLSHNTDNESREYVRFERHPATNISFATQPIDPSSGSAPVPFAGTYTTPAIQYNETEVYRPDASIQAVLLVCLAVSCSQGQ